MDKKKIIKIVGICVIVVVVALLFLFRVTIYNEIQVVKVKSAVKSQYGKPDYQISFINGIEPLSKGNGYRRYYDWVLVFLEENQIVYTDEANQKAKVPFTLSDYPYYIKCKVKDLDRNTLEIIQKYETNKFLLTPEKSMNRKVEVGDVEFLSLQYDANRNNIQQAREYYIPKSDNMELQNVLEQVKK